MATARRPATSAEAILQFVLDALHQLTGLPLLMVNQPDHNLPCLTRASAIETQMRADQKNAELLHGPRVDKRDFPAASWSDDEAPEEEISDLSDDEKEQQQQQQEEQDSDMEDGAEVAPTTSSTAQSQLFDGLQFYLAVSQVRERTVRSVLALGMAKTLTTLRERKQNESIAVIEQRYPDFTCLPTRSTAVQQQPPMDLLAALRLPSAAAVAQSRSPMKRPVRADEEGRVRRPSLPSHGPSISRVA
ncbi:RxLR effector candidate protein [Phytophthora cinnamomi]|uniref:RxLR effector candidate protein n=1 Tax=Phytophthora cinnamomi TaxID=4785 RepID=UPI00355A08AA|nr:RxLR effector candidate protein [Phytophthora cinnamomi]